MAYMYGICKFWGEVKGDMTNFSKIIIYIIGFVVMMRVFVVGVFYIQSNSMQPNLEKEDGIMVNRLAYGFRLPWQAGFIWRWDIPKRGEIVAFENPYDNGYFWLKRVIGVPGDTLAFHEHELWLNGEPIDKVGASNEVIPNRDGKQSYRIWSSWLENDWGDIVVPQGCLFLMGDHRGASIDSRSWGVLPIEAVYGKAVFRFWPLSKVSSLVRL